MVLSNNLPKTAIDRKKLAAGIKRLVVKVGSNLLASVENGLNLETIEHLALELSGLWQQGYEVLLVSSGATLAGMQSLGLSEKPKTIPARQAAAAIGQSRLMWVYEQSFKKHNQMVAQVLLTQDDLSSRHRFLNARNTLDTLLSYKVLPIINENDTVAVEELKVGDNDNLSALVTSLCEADLLVILSDIDGLYTADPYLNADACLIPLVDCVTSEIEKLASGSKDSQSTGGMITKLQAAGKAASFGVPTIITSGRIPNVLTRIMQGEELGTLFLACESRLAARKHWIAYALKPHGRLVLDDGAKHVIINKGKSLLPSGIKAVEGNFEAGDAVSCVDVSGKEFARGLVNYHAQELEQIKGHRTGEIEKILGYKYYDEVIHRNDLVLL
ncbi:MAG: glutamate 5-kinase [Candidatus Schekmanbacteria bacterium]|nr:glutamate 5-kinase [Candidatus Schekmanbacteria bacterium]